MSLISEIRQATEAASAVRSYDRDRLGYIEKQRIVQGSNFFIGADNFVVTSGKLAKGILAETGRTNHIDDGMYLRANPIELAKAATHEWAPSRTAAHKQMRRKQLGDHANRIYHSTTTYLDELCGREVDVVRSLKLASGQAMSQLILGPEYSRGIPELIEAAVDANLPIMNGSRLVPKWFPSQKMRAHIRNTRALRSALAGIIRSQPHASSETGVDEGDSLLASLMRNPQLTTDQLRSAVQVSLLASFGVPGAAVAWCLLEIKSSTHLEALARDEAKAIDDPTKLSDSAPILNAIVNEALRLYPPAWMISRLLTDPYQVGDLVLAAGTTINVVIYSIHRDNDTWDRADEFAPARWIDSDHWRKGTYIPFGSGPRVCIGAHLGIVEIMTMLWTLLRGYDVEVRSMDSEPIVRALLTPREFIGTFRKCDRSNPF